jgi:aspartyl-tRNA(Asn)/glutamyl-tRNA(Gln) amidotransferase subunit A
MKPMNLTELAKNLKNKEFTSVALTQECLDKIHNNKDLNAFISIDAEQALADAKEADILLKKGQGGPLTGIPMAVKDIFCTHTLPTTCASKMLAQYVSPYEAHVVTQLRQQGAILIGKTNMDEFAMGSANEHSYFGPVKNPWDKKRVPGGSSGGSAAAVAAGLVPFALGSDTGGSIRQPASFCGISGIKPSYGLASRFGMIAYASSLDQAGPMAQSAEDLAVVLQAMSGFDARDSTSVNQDVPDFSQELNQSIKGLKIGLPSCFFQPQVEEGTQKAIREAVCVLEDLGAEIIEMDLTLQSLWVPCYYVIACAEASSNLSRFDGIRFGHRSSNAKSLTELITTSRTEGFGAEVQRRILTGTHVLSSGYFDAYYLQAQKIRRLIHDEFKNALRKVDAILGSTTPTTAFKLGTPISDPVQKYLADVFTVAANLAGLPALSIPAGFDKGLPVGLQLMGAHFSESRLLNIAHQYQLKTNWHLTSPKN